MPILPAIKDSDNKIMKHTLQVLKQIVFCKHFDELDYDGRPSGSAVNPATAKRRSQYYPCLGRISIP